MHTHTQKDKLSNYFLTQGHIEHLKENQYAPANLKIYFNRKVNRTGAAVSYSRPF
jgi:hypothetical protein